MKKKTYIIALSFACVWAILISVLYLIPPYSKTPFKNLTLEKVESIYPGEAENNTYSEKEVKNYVENLRKIELIKRLPLSEKPSGDGLMPVPTTVKLKNGRKILFSSAKFFDGKYYVLIDNILYEAKKNE